MPKTLPEKGDYCYLTDYEGKRIGRVIDETEKTFKIKYWYDAFSGHVLVERQKDEVQYTEKPIGVKITMDAPEEETTDTEKRNKSKSNDAYALIKTSLNAYAIHKEQLKLAEETERKALEKAFAEKGIIFGKTIVICKETGNKGILRLSDKHARRIITFFSVRFYPLTKNMKPRKGSTDHESSLYLYEGKPYRIERVNGKDNGYIDNQGNKISLEEYYEWRINSVINAYQPTDECIE